MRRVMKILKRKNRFYSYQTIIHLDEYEFVEVLGDDIVVKKVVKDDEEKKRLQEDHVQYEVDEQLRDDAQTETDDEWR